MSERELVEQKAIDDYIEVYEIVKGAVEDAAEYIKHNNENATYVDGYSQDFAGAVVTRLKTKGWLP